MWGPSISCPTCQDPTYPLTSRFDHSSVVGVPSPGRQVQHRSEMTAAGQAERGTGRAKLASVHMPDERTYLYELIQIISAGPNLEAILRGVVRLVTEATCC